MAEEPIKKDEDFIHKGKTAQKIQAVKGAIALLFMAAKNHTMYPEKHAIYQDSLKSVMSRFDGLLKKYGDLRFDVEKSRLLFEEGPVHLDDSKREKLAYPLFRDGIQWMEFQVGLELWEFADFIKVLNQYRRLQEEPKGDLVTALWEMDLPHLQYAATDVLWKTETVKDFSDFSLSGDEKEGEAGHGDGGTMSQGTADTREAEDADPQDPADTTGGRDTGDDMALSIMDSIIWEITPEELKRLEEMVAEEETQTGTQDVLDVLKLILRTQNEPEDYAIILEFIKEEFKATLAQGEFRIALDFLESLKKTYLSYKTKKPWAQPLLRQFFVDIADPKVLNGLIDVLPTLDKQRADQITVFRKLLLRFPPAAITALGPMLLEKLSGSLEKQLMEIIGSMALKDIDPLKQLLNRPEEALVKKLVYILGHINGEEPMKTLFKMTEHTSDRVRLEAMKALTRRKGNMVKEVFPLINDPVFIIRRMMWDHLEQYKNEETGDLILDFLEQKKLIYRSDNQVLNCYKMLGECDTLRAIPFLSKTLIGQGWDFSSERSLQRQGAALALLKLKGREASEILEKASNNLFPTIRSAHKKALKDYQ